MRTTIIVRTLIVITALALTACSSITNITNSLTSLGKLEFKVASVENMRFAGVSLARISSPSNLSIADGISLANAFARKSIPASFTVNVDGRNPNNGSGSKRSVPLTLEDFDWRLLIDGKQTISGGLARPIDFPGTSSAVVIPLAVQMDMYSFFADRGYDGILNLALALGGVNGSAAKVKVDAKPTVGTPYGKLDYPGRITIVNTEYRGN